jgi:DNA modification methylase
MSKVETIGDCTIYLGDCREILPTLGKVDFIFTDPPYGHNNNNGDLIHNWEKALALPLGCGSNPRPIANDGPEETRQLIEWLFAQLPSLLEPGCCCCCCCCCGGGPDPQFARWALLLDQHLDFKQMVVWDKGPMGMGWHYRRSYETVLVAQKAGAACRWFDETDAVENIIRPKYRGIRKIIPSASDHPTPKPPELAQHFIKLHTQVGDLVLDPFLGGGSTGVAAVKEGRRFIGCEIDPEWFDLACRRIEEAYKQPDLFVEQEKQPAAEQMELLG